jgi:hypothetical protein
MNMTELFTATQLVFGPAPKSVAVAYFSGYEHDVIEFWESAGVQGLGDKEHRKLLLTYYYEWDAHGP